MAVLARKLAFLLFCGLLAAGSLSAVDTSEFNKLSHLIDSARVMGASTFAPKTMKKAEKEFSKAREAVQSGRKQKTVNKNVAKASEFVENSLKATEVAKLSLNEYLEPRKKAISAKAVTLVPELYFAAENQFVKATEKIERGDVKGGLKEARKSSPLYDKAELEAIRRDILGTADALIAKAKSDGAEKFALSTLDKARTARTKANAFITNDRYNRVESIQEAQRSGYEARHASNFALSVRSLNRNDQAWEKLMLVYEIQMNRVGEAIGTEHLPFDQGPLAAADSLIRYIESLQIENSYLTGEVSKILTKFGDEQGEKNPEQLVSQLGDNVDRLLSKQKQVATELESKQARLTSLEHKHQTVTAELGERQKHEEKFRKAKMLLNPSEGQVLFNAANDIVLRLSGLSFDIGRAHIKDEHIPLLEKVKEVVTMFPNSKLIIEGHTDATGKATTNVLLSEKRAYAVMQYLRQTLLISASRIQSIGYGSDKPVASNKTADGRAKNRRIDVIIMH